MQRRDFLRSALITSALYGFGALPRVGSVAQAAAFPALGRRLLVNVQLEGAPDLRYLFPPAFDADPSSFGYRYWQAMAGAHAIGASAAEYESRWNDGYTPLSFGDTSFGILNTCTWLREMWDRGKVAIVCNVLGASSRSHPHGLIVLEHGDRALGPNDQEGSGWGGRLAAAAGGRALALTQIPSPFCYGPNPQDPHGHDNSNMITAHDTRALTLFGPEQAASPAEEHVSRSLTKYYEALRGELPSESVYRRFVDAERTLRELGEPIDERLATVPVPAVLAALYDDAQPVLMTPDFGLQVRNVYDALLCSDILQPSVVSLAYSGFDTHKSQRADLEPRLVDLFGGGMAFDTLYGLLPSTLLDDVVLVLSGEFGRQIRANGDGGSDHGEGNTVLIIGESVRGGVYGDMFPEAELSRLGDESPQILGQTGIEPLFGAVCDWIFAGSGNTVFPGRAASPVEEGVVPGSLFS